MGAMEWFGALLIVAGLVRLAFELVLFAQRER